MYLIGQYTDKELQTEDNEEQILAELKWRSIATNKNDLKQQLMLNKHTNIREDWLTNLVLAPS